MALTYTVPKVRMWHLIGLVAVAAVFLSVFRYRGEVADPNRKLVRTLRYGDRAERLKAALQLQPSVDLDDSIVDAYIAALHDDDPQVRSDAAQSLGYSRRLEKGDPKAQVIEMALTEALRDPVDSVRFRAAASLVWFDSEAKIALPVLMDGIKSTAVKSRREASLAISNFIQENADARHAQILAASDSDASVRAAALQGMTMGLIRPIIYRRPISKPTGTSRPGLSNPTGPQVAPRPLLERGYETCLEVLKDRDPMVRWQAAIGLSRFAGFLKPTTLDPRLIDGLDDPDAQVRVWTVYAIRGHSTRPRLAIPHMIRALADPSPTVRTAAAGGLGSFGVHAEAALPALEKVREELLDSKKTHGGGYRELWTLDESIERIRKNALAWKMELFPNALKVLDDADDDQRRLAADTLGAFGALAEEAIPKLQAIAQSDVDEPARLAAARSIKLIEADLESMPNVNDSSARATPAQATRKSP